MDFIPVITSKEVELIDLSMIMDLIVISMVAMGKIVVNIDLASFLDHNYFMDSSSKDIANIIMDKIISFVIITIDPISRTQITISIMDTARHTTNLESVAKLIDIYITLSTVRFKTYLNSIKVMYRSSFRSNILNIFRTSSSDILGRNLL